MLIRPPADIAPSEITDERLFHRRRRVIAAAAVAGGAALAPRLGAAVMRAEAPGQALDGITESALSSHETPTPYKDVTSYNNFYEFGTDKRDPALHSGKFQPRPWRIRVLGECEHPGEYALDDFIAPRKLEERIYRLRCVEAWSMVVPWVGVPLARVIERFAPTSRARYVAFRTVFRPAEMPGQRTRALDWPYVEGLRIDEATHPLALLAVGVYGRELPNQNGAPLRLVVPWKYGFKSIKSIVSMRFTEKQPPTTWNLQAPGEYGFYANVNPRVRHPRWSQARERRIGDLFKRDTLAFNGYSEQVASLYHGMDLSRSY